MENGLIDLKRAIKRYNKLNNSFKRTLVFHVGAGAGFFSEYNCMILAILYCLKHKIRFVLYSKDANFGYKDGWNDFFEPFCEQTTCFIHKHLNVRLFTTRKQHGFIKWRLKGILLQNLARLIKIFAPFSYFTQDLWSNFFNTKMLDEEYDIPELDIKGDFVHACKRLVELTWNYNSSTKEDIINRMNRCFLPNKYISCHIRGGDKITEWQLVPLVDYVNVIKQYDSTDVFVLTDDYRIVQQLQNEYAQWSWHTLCKKSEKGYFNSQFTKTDKMLKKNALLDLFTSIEIMNKSALFIGTKTSNPSIFMSIYNPDITKGVDCDNNLFMELTKIIIK
jgi:hypothetical protein